MGHKKDQNSIKQPNRGLTLWLDLAHDTPEGHSGVTLGDTLLGHFGKTRLCNTLVRQPSPHTCATLLLDTSTWSTLLCHTYVGRTRAGHSFVRDTCETLL